MPAGVASRLTGLRLTLPPVHPPLANYAGAVAAGGLLWVSGQGPTWGKEVRFRGRLGDDLTLEQGCEAARLTVLNLLAQAEAATGGLDRLRGCARLLGMVRTGPGFTEADVVIDAAADLLRQVFDEAPPCTTVGMAALPLDIPVELEAAFRLE